MATKLSDYIAAANSVKKARAAQRLAYLKSHRMSNKSRFGGRHAVRGCDKRKYEALVSQSGHLGGLLNEGDEAAGSDEEEENFRSVNANLSDNESSVMFYSMMSESIAFNNNNNNSSSNFDTANMSNSPDSTQVDGNF